ncbi:4'-phosphopantetheinyl transferase [Streptomyces sp. YIM 121038]|uniref:hypothetical protein n=1 Tax=Streptomyces sp. YIM 121038 TaxID=2136401 RepID=UPI0011108957|nr:hypothetical protein [Streptomyces sp. YIM 121038]QCX73956.1 4'-phosphopantetheinyl transferase [Streptomyces sp. YIM 121038]
MAPPALVLLAPAQIPDPDDACWRDWLTAEEISFSRGFQRAHEHLAARRAAKAAVASLLGLPADHRLCRALEVVRAPGSGPVLRLGGAPAHLLRDAGLPHPRVSLTHARGHAAALAWLPVPKAGAR